MSSTNPSVSDFLRLPRIYPEKLDRVKVRETHISWVFLTEKHAYKLKKPVKFDFLDFSTRELRRAACEDELRLNRRLAPEVYLDVLPITVEKRGSLKLDGDGEAIDWVVKMRRLPDDQSLAAYISAGKATRENVQLLAARLTEFYHHQPPVSLRPETYRSAIENHVRANRAALLATRDQQLATIVKRVHAAQLRYLLTFPDRFDKRVCDCRIVEGHGDLRPEHIYFSSTPIAIDCLEFNAELRQLDVLDELCFLEMECEHSGAGWIGREVIEHYCRENGDRYPYSLRAFYLSYRACVRAKVNLLRAEQPSASEREQAWSQCAEYMRQADQASSQLSGPVILVVRGLSGVGKSTLAQALVQHLGTDYLQTDAIRRELFESSNLRAEYNQAHYSIENRNLVYETMLKRAEKRVAQGLSVVLDGTFLRHDLQSAAVELARRSGASALLVNCTCPAEVAAKRMAARSQQDSLSEADFTTYNQQLQEQQPPPPELPQCEVDTTVSLPKMIRKVLNALKSETNSEP